MKPSISTLPFVIAAAALGGAACARDQEQPGSAKLESAQTTTATTGGTPATSAKGLVVDIGAASTENSDYRRVLYTAKNLQLVVMALQPGEDIGEEVHPVDQFFRVEAGTGEAVINEKHTPIGPESAVVVPAGAKHDIVNTGTSPLQLYTIYAPPHHRDGTVHRTRTDAQRDTEHFDGRTTENLAIGRE